MNVTALKRIYFIGIGGIGMSALARFFHAMGAVVGGYDRYATPLTRLLEQEGMTVHYTDDVTLADKNAELVVYTPAIPANHTELNWYRDNAYPVYKRSDVLQWITQAMFAVTVAGTHGKTTISTLIAYLLREAGSGCNAFLGGISVNYNTNYWSSNNDIAVIEADEYDRSFLKLHPDIAVLTAIDPDHLDIYGTPEAMEEAFISYTRNIKPGGTLLVKYGLHRATELTGPNTLTYSLDNAAADVHGVNIVEEDGGYIFGVAGSGWSLSNIVLNIGGLHNVENTIAAIAVCGKMGLDLQKVTSVLAGFKGIKRRFEYIVKNQKHIYIDDYAHHPQELAALLVSAKKLFPERRCVVCFQPHLFSRTHDLAYGFAKSLDLADEVLLMDIYPARELPVPGITSNIIREKMAHSETPIFSPEQVLNYVSTQRPALFITAGAGDIDKLVTAIKDILIQ